MLPGNLINPILSRTLVAVPQATGTLIGDMTDQGGLAAAFNSVSNADAANSAAKNTSTSGYVNNVGKTWSSPKILGGFDLYGPNNSNPFGGGGALTFKIQGSNDGFATPIDLYSVVLPTGASSVLSINSGITPPNAYLAHRIVGLGNGSNSIFVTELVFYELI